MKKKEKTCKKCKLPYKKRTMWTGAFGGICLHDDQIDVFTAASGSGSVKNNPEIKVSKALWGHNSSEKRYIENSEKRGNTVVRGSDGLLREITKKK